MTRKMISIQVGYPLKQYPLREVWLYTSKTDDNRYDIMDIHEIEKAEQTHATEVSGGVAALEANESPLCADTTSQCYIWL